MGKKVKIEIEQLEDGYYATIKFKRWGNHKVSSDTLVVLLKKIVVRTGDVYGETIFTKEVFDEE